MIESWAVITVFC